MNTIDQWEADAKEQFQWSINANPECFVQPEYDLNKCILALIELVREKDVELGDIAMSDCSEYVKRLADKALAFTEELK